MGNVVHRKRVLVAALVGALMAGYAFHQALGDAAAKSHVTIVVEDPLLSEGGTVVVLMNRIDQEAFDDRYGDAITVDDGEIALKTSVNSVVTFLELDAPPGMEYRFSTKDGRPVAERQVSVGEGGGYINATTGDFATSDVTFHHHIKGPRAEESNSRALDGSSFRIDLATCQVQPAIRICSGSVADLEEMLRRFKKSETP